MGMVYEPYLALTPHEDIFVRRLLQGDYFAEAAYASERGLSWMLTVVGDPLYRPFREPLNVALSSGTGRHSDHTDWLLLQKVQREIVAGRMKSSRCRPRTIASRAPKFSTTTPRASSSKRSAKIRVQ